jgi:hypothetical protein
MNFVFILLTYGSFNNTASSSDYIVPNGNETNHEKPGQKLYVRPTKYEANVLPT